MITGTCKLVRFDVHIFEKVSWIPSLAKRAKTDRSPFEPIVLRRNHIYLNVPEILVIRFGLRVKLE